MTLLRCAEKLRVGATGTRKLHSASGFDSASAADWGVVLDCFGVRGARIDE